MRPGKEGDTNPDMKKPMPTNAAPTIHNRLYPVYINNRAATGARK